MITSTKNSKIKDIRALQALPKARRRANAFVIEGVRLAEEALEANWTPETVLFSEDLSERGLQLLERCQGIGTDVEQVAPQVMKAASDTKTPQGILMVLPVRELPIPDMINFVLIPDQVRDPGNLGTLLRSAVAAGVQIVCPQAGDVDVYSPKVVRAAMGAHFRLPLRVLTAEETRQFCHHHQLNVLLAAAGKGQVYTEIDLQVPLALVIGGEAEGPSNSLQSFATNFAHIPMTGGSESLNAAMAGTLFMFEVARQRGYQNTKR